MHGHHFNHQLVLGRRDKTLRLMAAVQTSIQYGLTLLHCKVQHIAVLGSKAASEAPATGKSKVALWQSSHARVFPSRRCASRGPRRIMSDARTIEFDPKDYRLDGRLMRRIWRLTKPYWSSPRHWKSWVLMAFGMLIGPAWATYNYWLATVTAQQANDLVAHHEKEWYALFWLILGLSLGQWVYELIMALLNKLMAIQWYGWMTDWIVTRYLDERTYYDIAAKDDIDNPDERIQTNVEPFVDAIIGFPTQVLGTILTVATNAALLSLAKSNMTIFVVIYSTFVIVLQTVLYWPLIRKNFDLVASNADFRYGLLRVRDNAEAIAFFRGEKMEHQQVSNRVKRLIKMKMSVYYYQTAVQIVSYATETVWGIAPLFFIYPMYFVGKIEYGTIALVTSAAATLRGALTSLNTYIPLLANVAPGVVRLSQIVERYDTISAAAAGHDEQITIDYADYIRLDDVCFQTPDGEQRLAQHVSFELLPTQSLIITGQTGVGKSSILRSMAGLWTRGAGSITMPPPDDTMFVPQKPYMMLGTLKAQLLYPHGSEVITDAELQRVLERVCLADLIGKAGGLLAERDWGRILSLGEQQRISFARILISRPGYVFLDEATSAVDVPTEARLYGTLIESNTTFVSVGHRETILRFHDRALRLEANGRWNIIASSEIKTAPVEPLGAARNPTII